LGREHIIPDKLGGRLILHQAACRNREAKINQEIEIPTLKRIWLHSRTHLGLKSSEPKQSLPIGTWTAETSAWPNIEEVDFAFEEIDLGRHPLRIFAPRFQPPGILWGRAPTEKFEIVGISTYAPTPDPPMSDGKQSAVFQPFSPDGHMGGFGPHNEEDRHQSLVKYPPCVARESELFGRSIRTTRAIRIIRATMSNGSTSSGRSLG
jgi:hypothetical protein